MLSRVHAYKIFCAKPEYAILPVDTGRVGTLYGAAVFEFNGTVVGAPIYFPKTLEFKSSIAAVSNMEAQVKRAIKTIKIEMN